MSDWLDRLATLEQLGVAAVLVTVAAVDGSAPREAGAKMVVTAADSSGSIGGGELEFQAIRIARQMLRGQAGPSLRRFPLGPSLGQCCGGHVTLLFEPRRAENFTLALFGAGHVGRALVSILGTLPCRVRWIDPRPDAFPDHVPPNVTVEVSPAPEREVAGLPDGAWLLVMTHNHALDLGIVARALQENRFAYIGLIGSATKRARFEKRFRDLGIAEERIAGLVCPIGIKGIEGKQPGEIAIAAAADILRRREAVLAGLPLEEAEV
ncbi:xanthine dehydrogenase accessory protein XdhC [Ferrovibrio sp.]|uniref:xanthine dehydrogenase accessory protein XdhC n=1 Tax=Ferrovibrio sp. TaxID=1917215 RepID=UPI001B5CEE06|nr:xanthine dehydrogenase accessory protein XdhC [Ferrovibrio sp.]MBP7065295.1 xanthine dehydrogenase accessory protein XdhC [Ferrovibrio sp.]